MEKTVVVKITSGILLAGLVVGLGLAFIHPAGSANALPEYSAQTGEPCATCHISPSGGGARGPRGQAWVAGGKPGQVPDMLSALELLGVDIEVNESDYTIVPAAIPEPAPLPLDEGQVERLNEWLRNFEGN